MPGRVAAFASEWVAGFPSEWVAGFVGIRRDACLGEARVVARPWFHITRALCKGEARRRGVARRAGFGTRLPFRNPRPAFAPPPPEPGAGSSRAVGWGKASAMPRTLRGHGWGKFRWAGGCGIGCGRPGGPEAGCLAAGSRADTPALQDGGFDGEEAERREGGSSSAEPAEPICGAERRRTVIALPPEELRSAERVGGRGAEPELFWRGNGSEGEGGEQFGERQQAIWGGGNCRHGGG